MVKNGYTFGLSNLEKILDQKDVSGDIFKKPEVIKNIKYKKDFNYLKNISFNYFMDSNLKQTDYFNRCTI